jgi:hypothetical protein
MGSLSSIGSYKGRKQGHYHFESSDGILAIVLVFSSILLIELNA